jgi:hypothetical protein
MKRKVSLTPWRRVLPEKVTCFQLYRKFPTFYGTRMFVVAFTKAAVCPYPEADRSSTYLSILLPEDLF